MIHLVVATKKQNLALLPEVTERDEQNLSALFHFGSAVPSLPVTGSSTADFLLLPYSTRGVLTTSNKI